MFFRRSGSTGGDAGPRFAEDAAPLGAFRTRNEQCSVPAGFRSAGVQSNEPDFELLLSGLSWVNPTVERFLHHSKVETTQTRSCPCPCRGDASPALRGVCCWWTQSVSVPPGKPIANNHPKLYSASFYLRPFRPFEERNAHDFHSSVIRETISSMQSFNGPEVAYSAKFNMQPGLI